MCINGMESLSVLGSRFQSYMYLHHGPSYKESANVDSIQIFDWQRKGVHPARRRYICFCCPCGKASFISTFVPTKLLDCPREAASTRNHATIVHHWSAVLNLLSWHVWVKLCQICEILHGFRVRDQTVESRNLSIGYARCGIQLVKSAVALYFYSHHSVSTLPMFNFSSFHISSIGFFLLWASHRSSVIYVPTYRHPPSMVRRRATKNLSTERDHSPRTTDLDSGLVTRFRVEIWIVHNDQMWRKVKTIFIPVGMH